VTGASLVCFDLTGSLVVAVASAGVVPVPPIRAAGVHSLAIQPAATPIAIPVVVIAWGASLRALTAAGIVFN